jgi:tetracycline repressor-like protein
MDSDTTDLRANFEKMLAQVKEAHHTWISSLVERYPHLANKLWQHHERFCDRNAKLEGLPLLLTLDATLPLQQMQRDYSAMLDTKVARAEREPAAGENGPRQRSGQTRRQRTHEAIVSATMALIMEGAEFRLDDVAEGAGVSVATVYNHFNTKEHLLDTAYSRLLQSILNTS